MTITTDSVTEYFIAPKTVEQEVMQNIVFILNTLKSSVPLDRSMGISGEHYGKPLAVAETLLYQEIMDEIEKREPRAIIKSITFNVDPANGKIKPILEVGINVGQ